MPNAALLTLFPALRPIAIRTEERMSAEGFPIYTVQAARLPVEQLKIYPKEPGRWSFHLPALAEDVYPVEYKAWYRDYGLNRIGKKELEYRFNNWPGWDVLDRIQIECGWNKDLEFQKHDRCHLQQAYGRGNEIRDLYYRAQGHEQGVNEVWQFLHSVGVRS